MEAAPYDGRAVANHLVRLSNDLRLPITQLALLKILYYAHGWYLVNAKTPLIREPFEAWKLGPVVRAVRDAFAHCGDEVITQPATRFDFRLGRQVSIPDDINPSDSEFLAGMLRTYAPLGAWRLSEMTHEPGSPWDAVWNRSDGLANVGLIIRNDLIARYFESSHHHGPRY